MNKLAQILIFSATVLLCSCSEYVIVPQYVSVEKLNSLEAGMTKETVKSSLNVDPYDAYHSTENGCELYSYKYLHRFQEIKPENKHERGALRNNVLVYSDESDAFLYFEEGLLKDLVIADAKVDHQFVSDLIESCNGPVSGCTDYDATNYNSSAIIDDGSCEYCPCGYYKNQDYNPRNECEEQCIQEEVDEEEEDCSICDIVKGTDGNINISVNTTAPWDGTNQVVNDAPSNSNNDKNNKGNKSDNSQGDASKKGKDKGSKKLDKLKAELEKSKERDAKTGTTSKKTILLEKSIEKLQNK